MKAFDRFLQRWRIRRAARFIQSGNSVLDIGASRGELHDLLPEVGRYVGVDPTLAESRPHGKGQLLKGLFPAVLASDEPPFDIITMLAVLEHIPSSEQANLARNCYDWLVPGGRLVITVPSPLVDYVLAVLRFMRIIDGMSLEEHYGFEVSQTGGIFRGAGFELEQHRYFQLGLNNLFVFRKPVVGATHAQGQRAA